MAYRVDHREPITVMNKAQIEYHLSSLNQMKVLSQILWMRSSGDCSQADINKKKSGAGTQMQLLQLYASLGEALFPTLTSRSFPRSPCHPLAHRPG